MKKKYQFSLNKIKFQKPYLKFKINNKILTRITKNKDKNFKYNKL